jgi:hypothetical protein
MARISPINKSEFTPSVKIAFERHLQQCETNMTNMKATLGHSLLAFEVYMQWYPLYQETEGILGGKLACLYAYSISKAADCQLCAAFFKKILVDAGELPENIRLTQPQKDVLELGKSIVKYQGNIANHVYDIVAANYSKPDMVILIAFAGQMIATNIFNNVIETDIDDYLIDYLPSPKYH